MLSKIKIATSDKRVKNERALIVRTVERIVRESVAAVTPYPYCS